MLRSNINTALTSLPDSDIKTAALAALDKTPVHLNKDGLFVSTQEDIEHIIGIVLGKPLQDPLVALCDPENSFADAINEKLQLAVNVLFEFINELIQDNLFNRQTSLIVWNHIHNCDCDTNLEDYLSAFPFTFLQKNRDFISAHPELLEAMVEISVTQSLEFTSNSDFLMRMENAIIVINEMTATEKAKTSESKALESKTNETKAAESKTTKRKPAKNTKLSKIEFQILLLLAKENYFTMLRSRVERLLWFFQNANIYHTYIPALVLQHVKEFRDINNFVHYLKRLKEINFLHEVTASITTIHSKETADYLIAFFVISKRLNLLSLESIDIAKKSQPKEAKGENASFLGLVVHQHFTLAEAAALAQVNKNFNQIFQPSLVQRKLNLAKIKLFASQQDEINKLKQILTTWKQKRLYDEKNFDLLLDYFPILLSSNGASFIDACASASTKEEIDQAFQNYKIDNFIHQILNVLPVDQDPILYGNEKFYKNLHQLFIQPTFSLSQSTSTDLSNDGNILKQELEQLKKRSDANAKDYQNIINKLLHNILFFRNPDFIKTLLDEGADIHHIEDGSTIWHSLANDGDPEIARLLLTAASESDRSQDEKEAQFEARVLNSSDKDNTRPLHRAIEKHNVPMVRFLVDKKADVSVQDSNGNYPAHFLRSYFQDCVEQMTTILLTVDPKTLDRRNNANLTPMHVAIADGRNEAPYLFFEKYNVSLYPMNSESAIDYILKMSDPHNKKEAIHFLLFNYPNKLAAADKNKLWASIDFEYLIYSVGCFDLIMCLHVILMLTIQKPMVGVNVDYERLKDAVDKRIGYYSANLYVESRAFYLNSFATEDDYDARLKLATRIPVNVFIFDSLKLTSERTLVHTEHKTEAKEESKDEAQDSQQNVLVTLWKKMKVMMSDKQSAPSAQPLCLHLLNIVNALETKDYVKVLRAIFAAIHDYSRGPSFFQKEKIMREFADLFKFNRTHADQDKPLAEKINNVRAWVNESFSADRETFFEDVFSAEHRQFHEFLSQNLNDREAFCTVFMKLGLTPSATSRSDPNTVGKWIHEKQAAIRFSTSQGLRYQSLMPFVVPDQRRDGVEMTPVSRV